MKPNPIILFYLFIIISKTIYSQSDFHWDWVNQIHGDYQREFDYVIDNNKNIYVCGKFIGDIVIGDTVISQPQVYTNNHWSFLAKYNWCGDFQWIRVQSNSLQNSSVLSINIELDEENNIYIAGRYRNELIIDSLIIKPGIDCYTSCFLIKYNENGNLLWTSQVYGNNDDSFCDFQIKNDRLYLATNHYFWSDTNYIVFENYDTLHIFESLPYLALSSFKLDGAVDWIELFHSARFGVDIEKIIVDKEGNINVCGDANDTIFVSNDTVYTTFPTILGFNFLFKFTNTGNLIETDVFSEFPITSFYEGPDSDILVAGVLHDNIIINNDTLIQYNPSIFRNLIIGRFNSDLVPIWCNQVDIIPTSGAIPIFCQQLLDSLIYSMVFFEDSCKVENTFICNTNISYSFIRYNSDGYLISAEEIINTLGNSAPKKFVADDCGNIIHAGYFSHNSIFNNDTLIPVINEYNTFFGRINLFPKIVNLGPDTTVCNSFILEPDEQYISYSWNNGISNNLFLEINESGYYWLYAITDNYCSGADTIYVSVLQSPDINLGNDTTISIRDTLRLIVPDIFDSYIWQDSSNYHFFDIYAPNYMSGTHQFWVEIQDSICIASDTIEVTIINDSNIKENKSNTRLIKLFPIPSTHEIFIEYLTSKETTVLVSIYNIQGAPVHSKVFPNDKNKMDVLNISNLQPGAYFISVSLNGFLINEKIILN